MHKNLEIKSNIQNYHALFVDNFKEELELELAKPAAVLIDEKVYTLYKNTLAPILKEKIVIKIKAVETNKTMAFSESVIKYVIEKGFKRNDTLIAIGGGIIQDICCFTASILSRGVRWIFFPTTLLAQCDSCIGSKSSINVGKFKNLAGNFYPPAKIVIDTHFTETLEYKDILSGLGEAIKVHYLDEEKRFESIFTNYKESNIDLKILEQIIYDSLVIKKRVIEIDEYDKDYRNIMNYGHTLGHALETASNYHVAHGIAVTYGIGLANYLSKKLGFLSENEYKKMDILIQKNTEGINFKLDSLDKFWEALKKDKKNIDNDIMFILTKGFGKMFKHKMTLDSDIKNFITDYLENNNII